MAIHETKIFNERIFKKMNETTTQMPKDRLLRLPQVLEIIPISRTSFWNGVKSGIYPQGVKLGPRTRAWSESEIMGIVKKGVLHEGH